MVPMTKQVSPPTRPPRISVPVDDETMAVFKRLAKAGNMSTGKAMAEWLKDTVEAAELMAATMERARAAPKLVTAELHAMMLGMADQTKELQDKYSRFKGSIDVGPTERKRSAPGGTSAVIPPSCNTGGKVPEQGKRANVLKPGFPMPAAKVQAYADTNGKPPKDVK